MVLCHYDPKRKLTLVTDASENAIGAVLSHEIDNSERPVAFASRTLTATERRYNQLDRESLAIFWAVKKFFNYLFGRHFVLYTDCRPLKSIFAPNASKPTLSATRLLHYSPFLQGFDYEIKVKKSAENAVADFLSRSATESERETIDEASIFQINQIGMLPITKADLAKETMIDDELAPILRELLGTAEPKKNSKVDVTKYTVE